MKKVVLYGMGSWVNSRYLWLKRNFDIVGVLDKNPEKREKAIAMGWDFWTVDDLQNMDYDLIIVTSTFESEITSYLRNELHLSCDIMSGKALYDVYEDKYYNGSKVYHLGERNPDKTFVIIADKPVSYVRGFFSTFIFSMYEIMRAQEKGYIPVIDMKNHFTLYHESIQEIGKINAWEKFFLQPNTEYSLEEVEVSKNVMYSPNYTPEGRRNANLWNEDIRHKLHDIYKEHISMSDNVKKLFEEQYKQIFGNFSENDKILGVSIRGTDYTAGKPYLHSIQPSIEQVCDKIIYAIKNWGITKIYVNSDEEKSVDYVKEKFPGITFSMDYQRYDAFDKTKNVALGELRFQRADDAYRRGADYIVSSLLFTKCDCFISGMASGSRAVQIAKVDFEHEYIFDLGQYGIDDDAYIFTPDGKPIYINQK